MVVVIISLSAGVMFLLAFFMAVVLGWANEALHVEVDPRITSIEAALPGINCGGCGYIGCSEYAEVVVNEGAEVDLCPVGGSSCAAAVAAVMGMIHEESCPEYPIVHCAARKCDKKGIHEYRGEQTCTAATLVAGIQGCAYGCISLGDCVRSCKFDALHLIDDEVVVDYSKCVGCGVCQKACPRDVIGLVPFEADVTPVVACRNRDFGKDVKGVCGVGCIGCKLCVKVSEGLFAVSDELAAIDYDKYDPETSGDAVEAAVEKCPTKCIIVAGESKKE